MSLFEEVLMEFVEVADRHPQTDYASENVFLMPYDGEGSRGRDGEHKLGFNTYTRRTANRKLTDADAARIRSRYPESTIRALAADYNVSPKTIHRIIKGVHYT